MKRTTKKADYLVNIKKIIFYSMISAASLASFECFSADELLAPDELHSIMPTQQVISGIVPGKDQIWIFPSNQSYMMGIPFKPDAKKRLEKFGTQQQQIRIPLEGRDGLGKWRGMYGDDKQRVVWDGEALRILVLRNKDLSLIRQDSVPVDLLKPASDRGGEATKAEISRLRTAFRAAFLKTSGVRFTGVAEIPEVWEKGPGRKFLVASRIKGFPLLMMTCAKDDAASCLITRQCALEGSSQALNNYITGLAIDAERREVIIGNEKDNSLEFFKFHSCGKAHHFSKKHLPSKMAKIGGMAMDDIGRLWITTGIMDTPFDANVFYWEKDQWRSSSGLK